MTGRPNVSHAVPPKLGMRLLGRLLPDDECPETTGDLEERFQLKVQERGAAAGRVWFWFQVLHLILYLAKDHILWSTIMFKYNFIIAWRNIKKSKVYSALNVLGLAVGLAVFILFMLYVRYEFSYDRYHANAQDIYQINQVQPGNDYLGSNVFCVTPGPLAAALAREFPEVLTAARVGREKDTLIRVGSESLLEKSFFYADPQAFEVFSFPIVQGDRASALKDPFSILLSQREARRLFGPADPVGRTILLPVENKDYEFRVTGVFRDVPANSHFVMDIVAPFETMAKLTGRDPARWDNSFCYTYVLFRPGTNAEAFRAKLPAFIGKYATSPGWNFHGRRPSYLLQPLTRIHLHSRGHFQIAPTADARFVLLFASIAVLVLVIACVNYMNLATARSLKRVKEIGLRKVVGAAKSQIIRQFLGDSMLTTFLALFFAVGFVLAFLPAFRAFVGREFAFDPLRDGSLMPGLVLLAVVVGAAAGCYPAFFVSSFRPAATLKGTGGTRSQSQGLRNALIVFQFAASIALIICTIGVRGQLRYIQNKDMGYGREQILILEPGGGVAARLEAFKTELRRNSSVVAAAASASLPNDIKSSTFANWPGKTDSVEIPIYVQEVDYDFVDLYGLKIVQGRNFSPAFPSDAGGAFLINEAACKALGWSDPVDRDLLHWGNKAWPRKIVGVVKDFHMHSLHQPIMPLYIYLEPKVSQQLSIKIKGGDIPGTVAAIRKTWERFAEGFPFEYRFFDDIFDQAYRTEQRLGAMFSVFAGLAVLIACLGLIGLASFTAERKTKEIGIRKVLGASSSGVVVLLSREFMKWVVLANLIAWPVGYFALKSWLQSFAYRTSLTVPMFLGAGLAAFVIAAAVISLQTYRAASADPADSIRYE